MQRKSVVRVNKICVDQQTRRQIVPNHRGKERARLSLHRFNQIIIKPILRIKADIRLIASDLSQIEPVIGKVFNVSLEPWPLDQSIGLASQGFSIA